jgi:ribosomal protein L34E
MPKNTKIATCSYCGRRQTLNFSARDGHELACGACGAPIHEMKWLKPPEKRTQAKRSPQRPAPHGFGLPERELKSRRKKKKRKPMWKRVMSDVFEDAFDVIEDIFD